MFFLRCLGSQDQTSEVQDGAPISKHPRKYIHDTVLYSEGVIDWR